MPTILRKFSTLSRSDLVLYFAFKVYPEQKRMVSYALIVMLLIQFEVSTEHCSV